MPLTPGFWRMRCASVLRRGLLRLKGVWPGLILPHAGHVYCGRVLGATLAGVELPRTLVILCPNHTGRGLALALFAARRLGSPRAKCIIHDTSATVSGDTEHTVGYAGLHLFLA